MNDIQIFQNNQFGQTANEQLGWYYGEFLPMFMKYGIYLTDEKIDDILSDPAKSTEKVVKMCNDIKNDRNHE